jgi:hypothetical protein
VVVVVVVVVIAVAVVVVVVIISNCTQTADCFLVLQFYQNL